MISDAKARGYLTRHYCTGVGMAQSPLITLAAGAVGAFIGLAAPLINTMTARLGTRRQQQRELADKILDLFVDGQALDVLLGGTQSAARRKLYLLGVRLDDPAARESCEDLIKAAGRPGASENDIFPHWQNTIAEISRVSRGTR
jgi:hypothetical protein